MVDDAGWTKPDQVGRLVWGYDGVECDPELRVSVMPARLSLAVIGVGGVARGVLLTIFARYWGKQRPPRLEVIRKGLQLTPAEFAEALDDLSTFDLVVVRGDTVIPAGPFGADPYRSDAERPRVQTRRAPSGWSEIREAVFERDGYACVYCGSGRDLHCDHVHPVARGGGHEMSNLVTACATCNLSKGSKTVAEWCPDVVAALRK